MISITKLLFATNYYGDQLRYQPDARTVKNGVRTGVGPVVVWNSTKTCNLHCKHCYMNSDAQIYPEELTTEEAKTLIDDLANFHVPVLLFSGGEPLLRPDFFELAAYARSKGIRPTLSTNGTLITPSCAQKLKAVGVGYVGISLDGIGQINDSFRGLQGAFSKAMQGINNCVAVGQKVGLRFTLNKHNFAELENIFDFIEEHNIDRVCFYHLVYSGRGEKMRHLDLTHAESRKAMDIIIRRTLDFSARGLKKEILTVDNHCDAIYLYLYAKRHGQMDLAKQIKKLSFYNGGNRSGIAVGEIDPFGNVHPDQFTLHHHLGNIKKRNFADIWQDESNPILRGLKNRRPLLQGRCQKCQYVDLCNGNFRTRAEAVTGNFWDTDPACYLTDAEIFSPPKEV